MILFHRPPRLRLTRTLLAPAPYEPEAVRKPNRLGAARRRQFLAFIRRRGTVTLAQLCARWPRHVVVLTLSTLWEQGRLDVLDHDCFRAREVTR